MAKCIFVLNQKEYFTDQRMTIMEFARQNNIFIPGLCYFPKAPYLKIAPDHTVYHGSTAIRGDETESEIDNCGMCLVKIDGEKEFALSCETFIENGMVIYTDLPAIRKVRREKFKEILSGHPGACLTCDRTPRCPPFSVCIRSANTDSCVSCSGYEHCDLPGIADAVDMSGLSIENRVAEFNRVPNNSYFEFNPNLCVGCLRCVKYCSEIAKVQALTYVIKNGRAIVGTWAAGFDESGCLGCMGCVKSCPGSAFSPHSS